MPKSRIKSIVVFLALGLFVAGAVLVLDSPSLARPVIVWEPPSIVQIISPGQSRPISVDFIPSENLEDIAVRIVPEIEPFLQVDPLAFSSVREGEKTSLTANISIPDGFPLVTLEGTIQLRNDSRRAYAKPLSVLIEVTGGDIDQDGVWDDIQGHIEDTYPESEKTRAALKQLAQAVQAQLLGAADKVAAIEAGREGIRAIRCLAYLRGTDGARIIWAEFRAEILSTDARTRAYIQATEHLGGQVYPGTPDEDKPLNCNFDPDTMEN